MSSVTKQDIDNAKILLGKELITQEQYDAIASKLVTTEDFDVEKLKAGLVAVADKVKWAKTLAQELSIRTWIVRLMIVVIIAGGVYAYGWFKGKQSAPAHFHIDYNNEMTIQIPKGAKVFFKPKGSSQAYWLMEDGSKKKVIIKDIPELAKALKPMKLILEPIVVAGGSLGESGGAFDVGLGASWFRYYKMKLDAFITNKGLYPVGVSYSITDNSGIGVAGGIGWKGDRRGILYYRWRF